MKTDSETGDSTCLGMFVKYWEQGRVKTRLARHIGAANACELYLSFVRLLLDRLESVGDRRVVAFDPPDKRADFQSLAVNRWELVSQTPPEAEGEETAFDLGQRMEYFFKSQLHSPPAMTGRTRVVLIGSDTPSVQPAHIQTAFEMLRTHAVVIGPSDDGGYWLIGMNRNCPDAFSNIRWSTCEVFSQTVAQLDRSGVSHALLPVLNDVDEWEDLLRLAEDIRSGYEPEAARKNAAQEQELKQIVQKIVVEFST